MLHELHIETSSMTLRYRWPSFRERDLIEIFSGHLQERTQVSFECVTLRATCGGCALCGHKWAGTQYGARVKKEHITAATAAQPGLASTELFVRLARESNKG